MSADMAVDYKTDSNPTKFDVEADQNRALHYEEKFLWDHQQTDHSGVDLPAVDGSINKTGSGKLENSERLMTFVTLKK